MSSRIYADIQQAGNPLTAPAVAITPRSPICAPKFVSCGFRPGSQKNRTLVPLRASSTDYNRNRLGRDALVLCLSMRRVARHHVRRLSHLRRARDTVPLYRFQPVGEVECGPQQLIKEHCRLLEQMRVLGDDAEGSKRQIKFQHFKRPNQWRH